MSAPAKSAALSHVRICDLTGLLAGAGATRFLAAFGAQVIRIEQPLHEKHRWDFLRGGTMPDGRTGINFGGNFNNHNVEKLSVTLDLKSEDGQELLARLVEISDVVTENFSAHVMESNLREARIARVLVTGGASRLEGFLELLNLEPTLFAKLMVAMSELLAARYRSVVEELEPVRALAASLRDINQNSPQSVTSTGKQTLDALERLLPHAQDDPEL